jgi:hypothetical protein
MWVPHVRGVVADCFVVASFLQGPSRFFTFLDDEFKGTAVKN